jgi:hypothetical protein
MNEIIDGIIDRTRKVETLKSQVIHALPGAGSAGPWLGQNGWVGKPD